MLLAIGAGQLLSRGPLSYIDIVSGDLAIHNSPHKTILVYHLALGIDISATMVQRTVFCVVDDRRLSDGIDDLLMITDGLLITTTSF